MGKNQIIQVLKLAHYYLPVGMYTGLSLGLFIIRLLYTGSMMYGFLVWNLFLAFIPFWAGIKMLKAINQGKNKLKIFLWVALWLGFLPNAPYILTDLFHLSPPGDAPLWYDLVLVLSFAITGWMFWLISINAVHKFLSRTFKAYWVYSILILLFVLSGIGVYMGRYGRWNSWDLMLRPYSLIVEMIYRMLHPFVYPTLYGVTLVFSLFLGISYFSIWFFGKRSFFNER